MNFERGEFQMPEYTDWFEVEVLSEKSAMDGEQKEEIKRRSIKCDGVLSRSDDDVVFTEISTLGKNQEYIEPMF